jgi:hypothetical protein
VGFSRIRQGKEDQFAFETSRSRIFLSVVWETGKKICVKNGVPLLLLSATCRPAAVTGILKSLKITHEKIFSKAELTRTKIWIA